MDSILSLNSAAEEYQKQSTVGNGRMALFINPIQQTNCSQYVGYYNITVYIINCLSTMFLYFEYKHIIILYIGNDKICFLISQNVTIVATSAGAC